MEAGLRISECLNLRKSDICLESNQLKVANGKGEKAVHDTVWKTAVFSVYQANEAYKVIYSFGLSEKEINGIILSTLQMEIKAKKGW